MVTNAGMLFVQVPMVVKRSKQTKDPNKKRSKQKKIQTKMCWCERWLSKNDNSLVVISNKHYPGRNHRWRRCRNSIRCPCATGTMLGGGLDRVIWICLPVRGHGPNCTSCKISTIEKSVSLDHTHNCIQTSHKNIKIHVRIHSTVNVIRACIFIMLSVLKITQRVPPTCITKTSPY